MHDSIANGWDVSTSFKESSAGFGAFLACAGQ